MIALATGLAAGVLHVVSGPDHLAALAPLAMRDPRGGMRQGLRWGAGHALGVATIALLGQVARSWMPVEALAGWAEVLVGACIVAIGLWTLRRAARVVVHTHVHNHGERGEHRHHHLHVGTRAGAHHTHASAHSGHAHAAFWVGTLHGVAGTGHLLAVLPSLALPPVQALTYVAAYAVGAIGCMGAFGLGLGWLVTRGGSHGLRTMLYAAGVGAVLVGGYWIGSSWPSA